MPIAADTKSLAADFSSRLARLSAAARQEGREQAFADVRELMGARERGEIQIEPERRGPGRPKGSKNTPKDEKPMKSGKKRRNSWAGLSPEARLARVNAIRKSKGLAPRET